MVSAHFQSNSFNITVIQVYAPTTNAEEVEVEWFALETTKIIVVFKIAPKYCILDSY